MVIAETTGTSSVYYLHGLGLVAQTDGTNVEYLAKDGLGSVRQVLNSSGSVLMSQTFDPYGSLYFRNGTNESGFGFAGEQTDSNGLVFLRARYYNPTSGRFFQMDPSRQERNPYWYSNNNPVMFTDPSGLLSTGASPQYLLIMAIANPDGSFAGVRYVLCNYQVSDQTVVGPLQQSNAIYLGVSTTYYSDYDVMVTSIADENSLEYKSQLNSIRTALSTIAMRLYIAVNKYRKQYNNGYFFAPSEAFRQVLGGSHEINIVDDATFEAECDPPTEQEEACNRGSLSTGAQIYVKTSGFKRTPGETYVPSQLIVHELGHIFANPLEDDPNTPEDDRFNTNREVFDFTTVAGKDPAATAWNSFAVRFANDGYESQEVTADAFGNWATNTIGTASARQPVNIFIDGVVRHCLSIGGCGQ